jgi:pyruvate/2-oxoglutarate dehydrogenase complex dihydrolipoamide dehydrogenase (E3) component
MKKADVVVVGGSAAGPVAAISCRRRYGDKSVMMVRKEEQVLVPCGIPYIFGSVGSPAKNLIPDALIVNNGIELVKGEAVDIDREKKTVSLSDGETVSYDKLVLATGSSPIVLPIPGVEKENVFTVRKDVPYLTNMLRVLDDTRDIVVIGGGFIGVEFADECKKGRDCNVTIIELLPHCLQLAFDDEFCAEAETVIVDRGINLLVNNKVEAILGDDRVSGVRLSGGQEIKADMVILGIGTVPNNELAKKAGLELGPAKAIAVDGYMRTITDPDIFACGDCAEKVSFFGGTPSRLMLASIAGTEARIAGANLFYTRYQNPGAVGVFSTVVGERAFACAGLTERAARRREGYEVVLGESSAPDTHPGGMPGSVTTKVKLLFSKDNGELLGGGISGGKSTTEMANVISACIQNRMTAYDLALFQMGTHPALTASPIIYPLANAAEVAITAM